ncbi:MAG: DUF3526 domain-containing protein [Bacteroidota bacterium]
MKTLLHIISFEWRTLWRSSTLKLMLAVILGAGIYGIFFGKFEVEKQEARMAEVEVHEKQAFDSLLVWVQLDTAVEAYKEKYLQAVSPTGVGWSKHFTYYLTHETPAAAGLCLGQRDLFPVYYGFNVTDLARQMNVAELANPMKLLTGNFDLSYVIIFLLPLLIIALMYDIYAAEKERGTLLLLQSQPVSINFILFSKGLLRFVIILLSATLLLGMGFVFQGISFQENATLFFEWLFILFGYSLFWTLLMVGIVAFKQSAALNAMLGLGSWLFLALITPAVLNLFVLAKEPVPNRSEVINLVRDLNGKNWDQPKSFVLDKFYQEYPQFNDGDTTDFNKWYYASFTTIDKEAKGLKQQFEAQTQKRNTLLKKWAWLAPPAMVHEKLSALSQTDRDSQMAFLSQVETYHQELVDLYYTRIFAGELFSQEDLKLLQGSL